MFPCNLEDLIILDAECVRKYKNFSDAPEEYKNLVIKRYKNTQKFNSYTKNITAEQYFEDEIALFPEYNTLIALGVKVFWNGEWRYKEFVGDEFEIVKNFNKFLKSLHKSKFEKTGKCNYYLCGHNIKQFDIPLIVKKMFMASILPHKILWTLDAKPWELKALDSKDLWKQTARAGLGDNSLDAVCYSLNIPSPKDEIDGSQVSELYFDGKMDEIKKYLKKDVDAVQNIFEYFYNLK